MAVARDGAALRFAAEELRANRDFVLAAVTIRAETIFKKGSRALLRAYQHLLARIACQRNSDSHKGSADRRDKGSSDKRDVSRFFKGTMTIS